MLDTVTEIIISNEGRIYGSDMISIVNYSLVTVVQIIISDIPILKGGYMGLI